MSGFAATSVTLYCPSQNNDIYASGLRIKRSTKITNIGLSTDLNANLEPTTPQRILASVTAAPAFGRISTTIAQSC